MLCCESGKQENTPRVMNPFGGTALSMNTGASAGQRDRLTSGISGLSDRSRYTIDKPGPGNKLLASATQTSKEHRDGKTIKKPNHNVVISNKTVKALSTNANTNPSESSSASKLKPSCTSPLMSLHTPSVKPPLHKYYTPASVPGSNSYVEKANGIGGVKTHKTSHYITAELDTSSTPSDPVAPTQAPVASPSTSNDVSPLLPSASTQATEAVSQLTSSVWTSLTPSNQLSVLAEPIQSIVITPIPETTRSQAPPMISALASKTQTIVDPSLPSNVAVSHTKSLNNLSITLPTAKSTLQSAYSSAADDTDMDVDSPITPVDDKLGQGVRKDAVKEARLARRREANRRAAEKRKQQQAELLDRMARLEAENAILRKSEMGPVAESRLLTTNSKSVATDPELVHPQRSVAGMDVDGNEEETLKLLEGDLIQLLKHKEIESQTEIQRLVASNVDLTKQLAAEVERSKSCKSSNEKLETQLVQLRSELDERERSAVEMSRLVQAEVDLTTANDEMREELEREAERTRSLTLENQKKQDELQRLAKDCDELKNRLAMEGKMLSSLVNASNTNLGVTQRRLDAANSELRLSVSELSTREADLLKVQTELLTVKNELADAKSDFVTKEAERVMEIKETKAESDRVLEESTSTKEELGRLSKVMEDDRAEFELRLKRSEACVDELKVKLNQAEKQIPSAKTLAEKSTMTEARSRRSSSKSSTTPNPSTNKSLPLTSYPYTVPPSPTPADPLHFNTQSRKSKPRKSRPPITPKQRLALPEFVGWLRQLEDVADEIIRLDQKWNARQAKASSTDDGKSGGEAGTGGALQSPGSTH